MSKFRECTSQKQAQALQLFARVLFFFFLHLILDQVRLNQLLR